MEQVKTFPVLKPATLVNVISSEWGISVTEQDLKNPKADTVQKIYMAILTEMLSLDMETFQTGCINLLCTTENPELSYDAMGMQMLLYHMARVAKVCKVQTFTMRDLTRPTGSRLIRILSGVCNFGAFSQLEERRSFLENIQHATENKQEHEAELAHQCAQVEAELQMLQQGLERDEPMVVQAEQQTKTLAVETKALTSKLSQLMDDIKKLKEEKLNIKQDMANLVAELQEMERQNAAESSRLMKSPERVRKKISSMTTTTESLKPQLAAMEARKTQMVGKDAVLANLVQDLREVIDDMRLIKGDLDVLDAQKGSNQSRTNELAQMEAHLEILKTQLVQAERQRARAQEKLEEIRVTHQQKEETARKRYTQLEEHHRYLEEAEKERNTDDSHLKDQMDLVRKKQDEFIDEQQAEFAALTEEYYNIIDGVGRYMNDVDKHLGLNMKKSRKHGRHGDAGEQSVKKRRKTKRVVSVEPPSSPL
ncbi:hypothetical protein DL93DRAFT_2075084 [Clavulina sp. PMI_390]|nr:hypothetical protein DL93DRAFT_2075084 [Clavulina sp. PMI_390]